MRRFRLNVGKRLKYMEEKGASGTRCNSYDFALQAFIVLGVVAFFFMPAAIVDRITEPYIYPVPVQILASILVALLVLMFAILMIFGKAEKAKK